MINYRKILSGIRIGFCILGLILVFLSVFAPYIGLGKNEHFILYLIFSLSRSNIFYIGITILFLIVISVIKPNLTYLFYRLLNSSNLSISIKKIDLIINNYFNLLLALIITISHVYSIFVFGSMYWVDTNSYINIAESMRSISTFKEYTMGNGYYWFSYVPYGIPLIWNLLTYFPESLIWPIFSGFQHLLAGFSIFMVFYYLNKFWPSRWHLFFCLILNALPFYQSLHGGLLTESIASSLLIIMFALTIKLMNSYENFNKFFFYFCLVVLLSSLFRGHFVLVSSIYMLMIILKWNKLLSKYTLIFSIVFALSVFSLPISRYIFSGSFFLPRTGLSSISAGCWVNPHPSSNAMNQLKQIPLSNDLLNNIMYKSPFQHEYSIQIAEYWKGQGISNEELTNYAENIGSILGYDSCKVIFNRFTYSLVSSGSILPYRLGPSHYEVFRGSGMLEQYNVQFDHYQYLSWISPNDDYYESLVKQFILSSNNLDLHLFYRAWQPYHVQKIIPSQFRDPLFLGKLPPDIFFIMGIIAGLYLLKREWPLGIIALTPFLVNFVATFAVPFGGIRYCYCNIPIYIISFSLIIGLINRKKLI